MISQALWAVTNVCRFGSVVADFASFSCGVRPGRGVSRTLNTTLGRWTGAGRRFPVSYPRRSIRSTSPLRDTTDEYRPTYFCHIVTHGLHKISKFTVPNAQPISHHRRQERHQCPKDYYLMNLIDQTRRNWWFSYRRGTVKTEAPDYQVYHT